MTNTSIHTAHSIQLRNINTSHSFSITKQLLTVLDLGLSVAETSAIQMVMVIGSMVLIVTFRKNSVTHVDRTKQ